MAELHNSLISRDILRVFGLPLIRARLLMPKEVSSSVYLKKLVDDNLATASP
jgi:hypothetical protein